MAGILRDIQVADPDHQGVTLGDIDRIQDGVLWEEKSAIFATDPERWVQRHIFRKFGAYLKMREVLEGYSNAPIGFHFEVEPHPELKEVVEAAIAELRRRHPHVTILLCFGESDERPRQ